MPDARGPFEVPRRLGAGRTRRIGKFLDWPESGQQAHAKIGRVAAYLGGNDATGRGRCQDRTVPHQRRDLAGRQPVAQPAAELARGAARPHHHIAHLPARPMFAADQGCEIAGRLGNARPVDPRRTARLRRGPDGKRGHEVLGQGKSDIRRIIPGDTVRARQRCIGLGVFAVLGRPAPEAAAVLQRWPPVADDRAGPHSGRHLSGSQFGEIDHYRLTGRRMLAAAPIDQHAATRLLRQVVHAALLARGHQRHRFAEPRARRHEMIGLRRTALGRAGCAEAQVELVLHIIAAPAAHHHRHGIHLTHRSHAGDRPGAHVIARDRAARGPLLREQRNCGG